MRAKKALYGRSVSSSSNYLSMSTGIISWVIKINSGFDYTASTLDIILVSDLRGSRFFDSPSMTFPAQHRLLAALYCLAAMFHVEFGTEARQVRPDRSGISS